MTDSRPIAYLETTFVSYLTSKPSRDLVVAAHQEVTREWWNERRGDYHLITSQMVLSESSAGDLEAAKRRLEVLQSVELVEITAGASELARALLAAHVVPSRAAEDALHIAIAA
jgi:hypothetical protein